MAQLFASRHCDANCGDCYHCRHYYLATSREQNVVPAILGELTSTSIAVVQLVTRNAVPALRPIQSLFRRRSVPTTMIHQNFHVLWQNHTSCCIRSKPYGFKRKKKDKSIFVRLKIDSSVFAVWLYSPIGMHSPAGTFKVFGNWKMDKREKSLWNRHFNGWKSV